MVRGLIRPIRPIRPIILIRPISLIALISLISLNAFPLTLDFPPVVPWHATASQANLRREPAKQTGKPYRVGDSIGLHALEGRVCDDSSVV